MEFDGSVGEDATWPLADSTQIRLFYVGRDEEELGDVASYAAREYDNLTIVTNTDIERAGETVQLWPFDCVVVEDENPGEDCERILRCANCPTILYTATDREDVDATILELAGTVVDRSAQGRRALFAKVLGLTGTYRSHQPSQRPESVRLCEDDRQQQTGCFLVDRAGNIRWSNVSFREFFGGTETEMEGSGATSFYRRLAATFEGGPETALELTQLVESGRTRHGRVYRGRVGETVEFFLHESYPVESSGEDLRFEVLEPVTDQLRKYDQVQLFEELTDNAVDGLFSLDADGYIEYCNRSYADMAGYRQEELVGAHVSRTMPESDLEHAQEVLAALLDSERESASIDITMTTREGEPVDVSYHFKPRLTPDGEYDGLIGVVRDITARKERERELEKYRTLVESAKDPMLVFTHSGRVTVCNEALTDFVGLDREVVRGCHVAELFAADSVKRGQDALDRILREGRATWESFDAWLTDEEGEDRLFEVTIGPVEQDEEVVEWVATLRDVTERHRNQQQLELIKQIFARSLRHNIRNKATVIEGFATALENSVAPEDRELLDRIRAACDDLATTSEKVSNLDWIVGGEFEQVEHDLESQLVDSIAAVRDADPEATIDVDLPPNVTVEGIRDLDFAFQNLVENALEHGRDGTPPTVTVEVTDLTDERVTVTIADDGPGIPDHEVEVLEQGEETDLEHASGLGLWLIDQVVEESSGDLAFEVDDGTRAHVTLRRVDAE